VQYFPQLFKNPFPKIKSCNASTKEIEKILISLQSENSYGCDAISMKILKTAVSYYINWRLILYYLLS
jgi:hypothetical protein